VRVLGIAGSLRSSSHNRELLRLAAAMLPDGVELETWEGLRDLPAFDEDDEETAPAAVARLRAAIGSADAVLLAVPEYNGSIPGALKNALDWASRPAGSGAFRGKPVAVVGASTGSFGGVWAQAEVRKVLGLMGARVVGDELAVGKAQDRLAKPDGELLGRLRATVETLAAEARDREAVAA
jgi:chromate reductase